MASRFHRMTLLDRNWLLGADFGNLGQLAFRTVTPLNQPGVPAIGVDRWSIAERHPLPHVAIEDLSHLLKQVEVTGCLPQEIQEMLYLQPPEECAKDARTTANRLSPIATGVLASTAAGVLQAGVFLDCSKCYELLIGSDGSPCQEVGNVKSNT
eukprot:3129683-Amphidinium_carterae.2